MECCQAQFQLAQLPRMWRNASQPFGQLDLKQSDPGFDLANQIVTRGDFKMKKQMTWIGVALFSVFCINAFAAGTNVLSAENLNNADKAGQFGVGAQVGSFSGLSTEFWMTNQTGIAAGLTFGNRNTAIAISHNWYARGTFSGKAEALVPFLGVGGLAVFGNHADALDRGHQDFALGVQVPLGLEFLPISQRYSVFGEVTPSIEVSPVAVGFLTGDLGARFYF